VTFGAVSANGVAPPTQVDGTEEGSAMYAVQSGVGAAGPIHDRRSVLPGKPVEPIASLSNADGRKVRNSPTPPRI